MLRASGFQIAFLILAFEFFAMLAARYLESAFGWPKNDFALLAHLVSFPLAALVLLGVRPLRCFCRNELARNLPLGRWPELIAVTLAKGAVPFALVGLSAAWAFATGVPEQITARIRLADPEEHWAYFLSPAGLLRTLVFSWLVGPVIEELVFRGILYRAWERQWGWISSLVLTSVCFGLIHPSHMLSAGLGGIFLVCVLRRFGTLRACIAVHILFNVIMSWPLLGHVLFTAPGGDPTRPFTWIFPFACLVLVTVALPAYVWLSRKDARAPDFR
jgi:membrane protease YdiL (CAAX protease family)